MMFRASPSSDTAIGLIVMQGLIVLPLVGAYLTDVVLRFHLARPAQRGAILVSKNLDVFAEVAKHHADASPRK